MLRSVLIALIVPIGLMIGGCPEEAPDTTTPDDMTPRVEAPTQAGVGDKVTLRASLPDGVDPNNVTFEWFQTYGRAVALEGQHSAEVSFVAPSLPADQTLRFRVDVRGPDGTIHSEAVELTVAADPEHGLDDSVDEGGSQDDPFPKVRMETSMGNIVIELNSEKAPLTVNNFLRYVDDGFYDNTLFHRVIADFMIQGGGLDLDFNVKETRSPIKNESDNGLKNDRGTIAMARQTSLDSATSQFFINVVDNDSLNATNGANGYAVFGRVVEGMDVVDEISQVETGTREGRRDVPVEDVIIRRVVRIDSGGASGDDDKGGGGDDQLSGG